MDAFGDVPLGEYDIYLKINDPKEQSANKRSIRFANKGDGIWDTGLGANLIGSTKVLPAQPNDNADIAFAKAAIENYAYNTTQSSAGSEAKALSRIKEIIGSLALRDVKAEVSKVRYTAPIAGTSGNKSGVDGSYVFTVRLEKGLGIAVDTKELTLSITANTYSRSGGSTTVPEKTGQTTTTETLRNGAVVTTVIDNATGNRTVTVKGVDGTVTVVDMPRGGPITAKVTLGSNVKSTVASIPIANLSGGTVAILVHSDETEEIIKGSVAVDGILYVPLSQNAAIKIILTSKTFTDIGQAAWAKDSIAFVTARELFFGTSNTKFSPNLPMTRSMLATVLYRLANEPAAGQNRFFDVKNNMYYADAVAWAAEAGVVFGVGNDSFAPDNEITREQLATILYRYAGSPGITDGLNSFSDAGQVSEWAKQAVTWAVNQGIIQGRTRTEVAPGANASRAEVAAMLQRFMAMIATD
jgi:hypothetical protein